MGQFFCVHLSGHFQVFLECLLKNSDHRLSNDPPPWQNYFFDQQHDNMDYRVLERFSFILVLISDPIYAIFLKCGEYGKSIYTPYVWTTQCTHHVFPMHAPSTQQLHYILKMRINPCYHVCYLIRVQVLHACNILVQCMNVHTPTILQVSSVLL